MENVSTLATALTGLTVKGLKLEKDQEGKKELTERKQGVGKKTRLPMVCFVEIDLYLC
mgnify:CR=1 FL=1